MNEVPVKEAFRLFKPESCVFVISVDKDGDPNGMVAGWNMKCSMDPPLFAVALSKKGNTHTLIEQSKEFVIAVPNKELEKTVHLFGSVHGSDVDKFKTSKVATKKARFVRSPLLAKATINFECMLEKKILSGDHVIFIGKVLAAHVRQKKGILLNMGKKGKDYAFREF
jgi:flavin reductase (DIM6/NTAB) family NADH-FMN oxidoreductase RutF